MASPNICLFINFPGLINEVIRGTDRYLKLKALRSAAERTNASAKDDFPILTKPKIRGMKNAGILSQMAVIVSYSNSLVDSAKNDEMKKLKKMHFCGTNRKDNVMNKI